MTTIITDPALIPTGTKAQAEAERYALQMECAGWTTKVSLQYFPGLRTADGRLITNGAVFADVTAHKGSYDGVIVLMWRSVTETPDGYKSTRRVSGIYRGPSGKVNKMRTNRDMQAWLRTLGI
jgi:hypothetical protein